MKNFKRVLSLALALLMVIGGLVVAPVDAKAETTYNRVWDKRDVENGGEFVLVIQKTDGKYYACGIDLGANRKSVDYFGDMYIEDVEDASSYLRNYSYVFLPIQMEEKPQEKWL